jgi:hypothetical protein
LKNDSTACSIKKNNITFVESCYMSTINIKLYDIARNKLHLSEADAKEFVLAVEETADIDNSKLATKFELKDEIHRLELQLYKAIFWAGLVQVLAVLGGLIAIIKFMLNK